MGTTIACHFLQAPLLFFEERDHGFRETATKAVKDQDARPVGNLEQRRPRRPLPLAENGPVLEVQAAVRTEAREELRRLGAVAGEEDVQGRKPVGRREQLPGRRAPRGLLPPRRRRFRGPGSAGGRAALVPAPDFAALLHEFPEQRKKNYDSLGNIST